jgi:hypothetical protein
VLCSICFKRIDKHTIEEARECTAKHEMIELERTANELCVSCGCPSDLLDPHTNEYWCNGCLSWTNQLNDERKD